jgi:hypothetical protein
MGVEQNNAQGRKDDEGESLLFKGPTVVAALVCIVAAVFSFGTGMAFLFAPDPLQGTLLINLSNGSAPSGSLLDLLGVVLVALGIVYVISAALLWSEAHWIKGVYAGIIVSIVGTLVSGLGTTLAPGIAAAGMIVNVLIVTLLATETWEARRAMK